jgi:hypothetical protein
VKVKVKVKRVKKQVQQQECDGGSWDCVGNCTRKCNNGGEFASKEGCRAGIGIVYISGAMGYHHQIEEWQINP